MSRKLTLEVPAISCGHCVARIEKALGALAGVKAVSADAGTRKVDVELGEGAGLDGAVRAALVEIGYPPEA
jgi:copper chaperone